MRTRSHIYRKISLTTDITIRTAVEEDLRNLEWFGAYSGHRESIEATYRRQQRGDACMLLADMNGFPVAQVWLELGRRNIDAVGYLWSLRVLTPLRNQGLGTALLRVAEDILRDHGFTWAELGVEKNSRANTLYERLGYEVIGASIDEVHYRAPDGTPRRDPIDQWICRKNVKRPATQIAERRF